MTQTLRQRVVTPVLAALSLTVASATAVAILADPAWAQGKSAEASGGNGGNGGNGGGKPEGKGAGKPDRSSAGGAASSRRETAGSGQQSGAASQQDGLSRSDLRGLNSLRRNINGLMNSSDPKMEGFRAFVTATAALEEAEKGLAQVQDGYDSALAAYQSLALSGDAAADLATLTGTLANLQAPDPDTATQEELDAHAAEVAALTDAIDVVTAYLAEAELFNAAQQAVDAAAAETSEQAMIEAFVAAMQASGQADFTAEDITPEMMTEITRQMERLASAYDGQ